jgi:hypothetical protein
MPRAMTVVNVSGNWRRGEIFNPAAIGAVLGSGDAL